MIVELTAQEVMVTAFAGVHRAVQGRFWRKNAHGFKDDGLSAHIQGVLAEQAVAKLTGRYWTGLGKIRNEDVLGLQVRSVDQPHKRLLLHQSDADDDIFVLVIVDRVRFDRPNVVGWIRGRDGKQPGYKTELQPGRPCYAVPNCKLKDLPI